MASSIVSRSRAPASTDIVISETIADANIFGDHFVSVPALARRRGERGHQCVDVGDDAGDALLVELDLGHVVEDPEQSTIRIFSEACGPPKAAEQPLVDVPVPAPDGVLAFATS